MRNFNNTVNYFFQKFYNNLKYSNRILFSLRIFFERTTKNTNIVSWLGNVYRNSKWSSLNIQNIKMSFRYQASSIFTMYLVFFIFVYVFRYNISILQFFLFTPSYFWYIIQDWLSYSSLLILSFFYFFIQKTDILFSTLLPNFFLSVGNNKQDKQTNTIILGKKTNIGQKQVRSIDHNVHFDETFLKLAYNLQKTVNTISLVDYHYRQERNSYLNVVLHVEKLNSNLKSLLSKFFILTNSRYGMYELKNNNISNNESKYKLLGLDLKHSNSISYSNLKLNSLLKYDFKLQKTVISNLSKNLMLSKENRWLWKSSLLSDKILVNLNKTVHLKKLISNPQLNDNIISNNIWGSNNIKYSLNSLPMNNINFTKDLKFLSNSFSSPLNLDNYEDSLVWATKRFSFTQKMSYNNQFIISQEKLVPSNTTKYKMPLNSVIFSRFYYNYNYTNLSLSFYKTLLGINLDKKLTSSNLGLINMNNQELFNNNDNFFIKLFVSNISFNKNEIIFYSII